MTLTIILILRKTAIVALFLLFCFAHIEIYTRHILIKKIQ